MAFCISICLPTDGGLSADGCDLEKVREQDEKRKGSVFA